MGLAAEALRLPVFPRNLRVLAPEGHLSPEREQVVAFRESSTSAVRQTASTAQATLGGVWAKRVLAANEKQTIVSNDDRWVECLFAIEKFPAHAKL